MEPLPLATLMCCTVSARPHAALADSWIKSTLQAGNRQWVDRSSSQGEFKRCAQGIREVLDGAPFMFHSASDSSSASGYRFQQLRCCFKTPPENTEWISHCISQPSSNTWRHENVFKMTLSAVGSRRHGDRGAALDTPQSRYSLPRRHRQNSSKGPA